MNTFRFLVSDNPFINSPASMWRSLLGRSRDILAISFLGLWLIFGLGMIGVVLSSADISACIAATELTFVLLFAPLMTHQSISRERELDTWESVLLTPIDPAQIFFGKVALPFIVTVVMLTLGTALVALNEILCLRLGIHVAMASFLQAQFMILMCGVLLNALGLCVSAWCRRSLTAGTCVIALLPAIFFVSSLVTGYSAHSRDAINPFDPAATAEGDWARFLVVFLCGLTTAGLYAVARAGFMDPTRASSNSGSVSDAGVLLLTADDQPTVIRSTFLDRMTLMNKIAPFRTLLTSNPMARAPLDEYRQVIGRGGYLAAMRAGAIVTVFVGSCFLMGGNRDLDSVSSIEITVLAIGIPIMVHGVICRERERGTWEAIVMTPLSPAQIMVGKLIWPTGLCLGLLLLGTICIALNPDRAWATGRANSPLDILLTQGMTISWALFALTYSLYISSGRRSSASALRDIALGLAGAGIVSGFLTLIVRQSYQFADHRDLAEIYDRSLHSSFIVLYSLAATLCVRASGRRLREP